MPDYPYLWITSIGPFWYSLHMARHVLSWQFDDGSDPTDPSTLPDWAKSLVNDAPSLGMYIGVKKLRAKGGNPKDWNQYTAHITPEEDGSHSLSLKLEKMRFHTDESGKTRRSYDVEHILPRPNPESIPDNAAKSPMPLVRPRFRKGLSSGLSGAIRYADMVVRGHHAGREIPDTAWVKSTRKDVRSLPQIPEIGMN